MVCKGHAEGCGVFDDDEECFVFHNVRTASALFVSVEIAMCAQMVSEPRPD